MYQFDEIHEKRARVTDVQAPTDDLSLNLISIVDRKSEAAGIAKVK